VSANSKLDFETWWENKGVAPCYRQFPFAIRLKSNSQRAVFVTSADIREWMPGDNVYNDAIFIPGTTTAGEYDIQVALLDPLSTKPAVLLAIEGKQNDGWYTVGKITVE
jgi:hypothetical protein